LQLTEPPRVDPGQCAFLLDVDGTLLPFAPEPAAARADAQILELLSSLHTACGGALALVSGRAIESLDALFSPMRLAVSGLHGLEFRTADGQYHRRPGDAAALEAARPLLEGVAARHRALHLEDKGGAIGLHYRHAPQLESELRIALRAITDRIGRGLEVLQGPMVLEIAHGGISKANGISDLMGSAPFEGRRPVYLGDDLTDEAAFSAVEAARGLSILVGAQRPTAARYAIGSVAGARAWLRAQLVTGRESNC
jgi:trehalose 6-phosphate phosphatase